MSFADKILGIKKVNEDDMTPYEMSPGAALRRRIAARRSRPSVPIKKKPLKEGEEPLIPSNAELISGKLSKAPSDEKTNSDGVEMPTTPNAEGMFPVATALIAPDVMPELYKPLSPAKIPAKPVPSVTPPISAPANSESPDALDVLLGKSTAPANPGAAPVTVENFMQSLGTSPAATKASGIVESIHAKAVVAAALDPSKPMPDHVASDPTQSMRAFATFF